MVQITEQLVRKKSEHNELMISTLEEVSLHQENIEKIEHIQNWCQDLKILLLQNNLIARIENVHKLKKLEYLNLAINNIERIENLERCESLQKLDLTLNFIGHLTSVESLRNNYNLQILIMTGNPCVDYPEYRAYVIGTLLQLNELDGTEITTLDKIKAKKILAELRPAIIKREIQYQISRDEQKIRVENNFEHEQREAQSLDDDERMKRFWDKKSEHCPETRYKIAEHHQKSKQSDSNTKKEKPQIKLFAADGRPLCMNHPKLDFDFDDKLDFYELNLHVHRFMDTSLIEVDLQPLYVRVTLKGKIFQLAVKDEVNIAASTTQRSLTTGHLLIKMQKLNFDQTIAAAKRTAEIPTNNTNRRTHQAINVKSREIEDMPPLVSM